MDAIYQFPRTAFLGRTIPKNKFYQVLEADERVKRFFIDYIERIVLQFKLSPDTVNLQSSPDLAELNVFEIQLKRADYPRKVIEYIEKAIPYPMLHVLRFERQVQQVIAYKVPHAQKQGEWVVQALYASEWQDERAVMISLDGASSMRALYDGYVKKWMPVANQTEAVDTGQSVEQLFHKQQELDRLNKEIARLETKLRNEKQFHKKAPILMELQALRKQRAELG